MAHIMNISLSPEGNLQITESNYSIEVPPTAGGAYLIMEILRARELGFSKLATPGAPTQRQVTARLRNIVAQFDQRLAETIKDLNEDGVEI